MVIVVADKQDVRHLAAPDVHGAHAEGSLIHSTLWQSQSQGQRLSVSRKDDDAPSSFARLCPSRCALVSFAQMSEACMDAAAAERHGTPPSLPEAGTGGYTFVPRGVSGADMKVRGLYRGSRESFALIDENYPFRAVGSVHSSWNDVRLGARLSDSSPLQ